MTPAAWISVATICVLGAASPGPSLAVVVRHTVSGSRARGLGCALAHGVGVGLYALLTAVGLAAVIVAHPPVYRAIAAAGALYLAWLGYGALRNGASGTIPADAPPAGGVAAAARDGFSIAFLNPKIAVFFLALFSQFVGPETGAVDAAVLSLTALTIDATWYTLVAVTLSGERALEWFRRRAPLIDRLTGVVLLILAAWTLAELATG